MIREKRITTMEANGAAPAAAASLYVGEVMHARMKPFAHRFAYRVFSLLLDLDRLPEAGCQSALFSVDRPGIVSFHQTDHADREGETLREKADCLLAEAGLATPAARILFLAYPRILGYVFNPISLWSRTAT